jgi:ferrous iron transport protein B
LQRLKVLLVGQPNVGKSSLLNALTGSRVQTSNYPGTTVEIFKAKTIIDSTEYEFIDTPGIYNLYPSSLEEEITERAILEEDYDFVILIIDATAIERGLAQALALIELGVPLIVAVNFWEEAEAKGVTIDFEGLEEELGVPVVKINPVKRGGLKELILRLSEARRSSLKISYDDHIEEAIEKALACLKDVKKSRLSLRGLAVRLVEGDPLVCAKYCCEKAEEARRELKRKGHDPYNDIEVRRAGIALSIARRRVRLTLTKARTLSRFDLYLMTNTLLGVAFSLSIVILIIVITVILGNALIDKLDDILSPYIDLIIRYLSFKGLLGYTLLKSVEALYAQYIAAVPYVFIFYILLVLLEDSGLLARMMVWMYGFTKKIGLHPKGVIPLLLGMGCSVPASRASRIMPGFRQKILTIAALAFIPCSSRASIIFGVAGRTLGAAVPIAVYVFGFIIATLLILILSKVLKAYEEAIMIEDIPPLRLPLLRNVVVKAWARLEDFLIIVTPLVVLGAMIYAPLSYYKLDVIILKPLAPIARLLGLPLGTMVPLVYGFLQKDLVISMLSAVLGTTDFLKVLTPHQIITFTLASTYQVPCIIALGSMIRELGAKRALLLWIGLDSLGFLITLIYARIL